MLEELKRALIGMKRQEVMDIVRKGLAADMDPLAILTACREAMEEVGRRFETGEFFLSELIYSAEVFKAVTSVLEPALAGGTSACATRGAVVFGTPKGDIHDLGKNIVITMMRAHGFTVHDLGVDVPPEKFVLELESAEAPILAMSALITPAFAAMKRVVGLLEEKGIRKGTFVIIGGGVTTEFARKEIGADAQTLDPTQAIRLCGEFMQRRGSP